MADSSAPTAILTNTAGSDNDHFAQMVTVSADGMIAMVGAYTANSLLGAAYVFRAVNNAGLLAGRQ